MTDPNLVATHADPCLHTPALLAASFKLLNFSVPQGPRVKIRLVTKLMR